LTVSSHEREGRTLIRIRPACKEDSGDIARLFLTSSDGLAEYIWDKVALPGESILETGTRRYARENVVFSYKNCLIAELDGKLAGMAHSYTMVTAPDDAPESDPVLKPYSELEDSGSLYLSGIAVSESYRDKGVGKALMQAVTGRARELALPRISLICFEQNTGAIRFYQRLGYQELDRRALVPHACLPYADGDAVLLVCKI